MTFEAATLTCTTNAPQETRMLAARIGRATQAADVILLVGELGAGKTVFTQGLAEGLDIQSTVNSPTFVLLREYRGRLTLYHYDLYRLSNIEQTITREWQEFLYGDGVSVVEWANRADGLLPREHLLIKFSIGSDTRRTLELSGVGQRYLELLSAAQCS